MSEVLESLRQAARWLPHQGPLSVFIHTNTLSEWEDLDFHDALRLAKETLGARVRPLESEYRQMLDDGRIEIHDLRAVFESETRSEPEPLGPHLPSAADLAWELLLLGLSETHWRIRAFHVAEGEPEPVVARLGGTRRAALAEDARRWFSRDAHEAVVTLSGTADPMLMRQRLREQWGLSGLTDALRACMDDERRAAELGFGLLAGLARRGLPPMQRLRATDGPDLGALQRKIDEVLLPAVAASLDLGQASWMPNAEHGLFEVGSAAIRWWGASLWRKASELIREDAVSTLAAALQATARSPDEHERVLRAVLLARPGWAGALAVRDHHHGAFDLAAYAALRLVLVVAFADQHGLSFEHLLYPPPTPLPGPGTRADRVAQLLAMNGIGPERARSLTPSEWERVEGLLRRFGSDARSRLLQEARERQTRRTWLSAVRARATLPRVEGRPAPRVQLLFCIDEREESLRRAVEEAGGDAVETWSLAGHFNLTMQWRAVDDVHASARHPIVLASTHRVVAKALAPPGRTRWLTGSMAVFADRTALGLAPGAVVALLAGIGLWLLATFRILWPRSSEVLIDALRARWLRPPPDAIAALRDAAEPVTTDLPLGFTPEEAADRIGGALRVIGLTDRFAPIVVVIGHGSTSLNNPHESAHDCGACGGHNGDANARVFASLANVPSIRKLLGERGIAIPAETVFLAGYHDTASEALTVRPEWTSEQNEMRWLRSLLADAAARDAAERGRRFLLLPPDATDERSLTHVRSRSADLSQVRPEYGHATNALLVVGPRARTRGLFFDRRAFLHSYDPAGDADGSLLQRLLAAAVPVCAGISLEYYFSKVDPEKFGSGTKLPHNVTGLQGVMNGALSDLRTGLPWQMVEIHEPTRLLVVVLAPRQRLLSALTALPAVHNLVRRKWIFLAALDDDGVWAWEDEAFVTADLDDMPIPVALDGARLTRGRRDPIAPALLGGHP